MEWEATVRKANNGYICTSCDFEGTDDLLDSVVQDVFEDIGDDGISSFIALVWHLAEYFGTLGSKHDEKRFWCGYVDRDGKPIEQ